MPNTKAAKKALRQNERNRECNLKRKRLIKDSIKKYRKLIETGKKEEAKSQLNEIYKTLDKMAKVKYIKEGKVKRMKSRLAKKLEK